MSTQTFIGTLVVQTCCNCGMAFGIEADYDAARRSFQNVARHMAGQHPDFPQTRGELTMRTIKELQQQIGEINAANGWRTTNEADLDDKARVNAQITRLALIMTEVAEAIEEIRNGHSADEEYHTISGTRVVRNDITGDWQIPESGVHFAQRILAKPEGVPSELADIVIRALDAAGAWGIDLAVVIEEKLAYNGTRGHRHGGKAV